MSFFPICFVQATAAIWQNCKRKIDFYLLFILKDIVGLKQHQQGLGLCMCLSIHPCIYFFLSVYKMFRKIYPEFKHHCELYNYITFYIILSWRIYISPIVSAIYCRSFLACNVCDFSRWRLCVWVCVCVCYPARSSLQSLQAAGTPAEPTLRSARRGWADSGRSTASACAWSLWTSRQGRALYSIHNRAHYASPAHLHTRTHTQWQL